MANLDQIISKIPKSLFVGAVFLISIGFMLYSKPLKNGCDSQISNFTSNVKGYLINSRNKQRKLKLADINTTKNLCKSGNSLGSCENYFNVLKIVSVAFVSIEDKCLTDLAEDESFSSLSLHLKDAIKILSLLAWGEKPPNGLADRAGWLSKTELISFCRLKSVLINIEGDDSFIKFRNSVYKEFPSNIPSNIVEKNVLSDDFNRPLAFKWSGNPSGILNEKEVLERSLFSIRCDQYQ